MSNGDRALLMIPPYPMEASSDAAAIRRVLVVDDVPEIGHFYVSLFRRVKRFQVDLTVEVQSARAIERLRTEHFDLVITDFRMPKFTGADIVNAALASNAGARCILMSGYVEASAGSIPRDGVDAIVAKPLHLAKLLALIEEVLEKGPASKPQSVI